MKALIMAGGYATRLWPLTKEKPKPLLLLNGKPLVSHIIEKIPEDIPICIATNKRFEREFLKWRPTIDRQIHLLFEETKDEKQKFGALGGIANCIEENKITEDLLVIGGDNFFDFTIKDFLSVYKGTPLIAAYNIGDFEEAKKFGVLVTKGSKLVEFQEKPQNPKSTLINTFCSVLPASIFPILFEFVKHYKDNFGAFFEYLLEKKIYVQVYVTTKNWFDIGSFEGYIDAHKMAEKARNNTGRFFGVDLWGKNTFKGKVFVDKGTVIKDSVLEDCIILDNCEIKNSTVKNCIIDEGCRIRDCNLAYEMIAKGRNLYCRVKNNKK